MFASVKKAYRALPNLFFAYPFEVDKDRLLKKLNGSIPRSDNPSDEETGICEIIPDDGRSVYISRFKVRRIACRQAGYEIADVPGRIRP